MTEWHEVQKRILKEKNLVNDKFSNRHSKFYYILPVPREKIKRVIVSPVSHIGNLCNAIDFLVPMNTEVYSAADGIVTSLKDDSNVGGTDPKYWYEGNYIVIKHNGESTGYEHFKYKGIVVEVADVIQQGQLIGYSGNTGYSRGPHLHFEVMEFFGPGDEDYITLKARFKDFHDAYETK
ncbi:M23 family metallopeptidase [Candidatus Bathyarchaeota archaeon]|nr:M23 family metallopeptidase [Candidatus Bathyarchaeota archaeon]